VATEQEGAEGDAGKNGGLGCSVQRREDALVDRDLTDFVLELEPAS
jgi:hypothetical protein